MRLSNKGRYGVRALFDIAFHNDGQPTQVKDIAEREAIPARFLEQIFQDLKRAGLVSAKRGPRGGYHLAKPALEIRLGDIIRALEGPISIAGREERRNRTKDARDATEAVFLDVSKQIERCLDEVSLADIVQRGVDLGLRRGSRDAYVYVI